MENINELTVQKAKNGDKPAFCELYSFYAKDLYHFAVFYLGNSHDAEDAVQNAVLTAYRSIKSLRKNSAFKSWLFKILANCCKEILKKRSKTENYIPWEDVDFLSADDTAESRKKYIELYSALDKLSETDRNIILLSVIGKYKSEEIADMFNMKAGTVRSRLSRAMEKLRKDLN